MEHVAPADGIAVDPSDYRFGNSPDQGADLLTADLQVQGRHGSGVPPFGPEALVPAGAEGLVPGPGEHHHPHGTVHPGVGKGLGELKNGDRGAGVVFFRPVDGDPCYAIFFS